jgi:hypothetical protein
MSGKDSFSFDLYPGLDAELNAAYARNMAQGGETSAEAVAASGIAAAVDEVLQQQEQEPDIELSAEARQWAEQELSGNFDDGALGTWRKYDSLFSVQAPGDLDTLIRDNPNMATKLGRLHEAKLAITAAADVTPEGLNVGETMHLTVVPWAAFKSNLERLPEWVKTLRDVQGIAEVDDFINDAFIAGLKDNTELYRNPIAPHFFTTNNTAAPDWLSARDYLDERIAEDGPWGVLLTQTSQQAGLQNLIGKSPDDLTDKGQKRFEIAGHKVDSLGVFEWLAMTFQHDPSALSSDDESWLLANRITVNGGSEVAYGYWYGDQVKSHLWKSEDQGDGARPRLAVI